MPTGEDEELVGDGVGCSVIITQSAQLNESSFTGQLGSIARATVATDKDGEDSVQFFTSLTTSAAKIDAGP